MTKYLDYEGLQKFKECADAKYLPQKGTIPITDKINLTSENVLTLGAKVAKVANNSMNFYIIADSQGKLPSSETRINIPSSITSLVGAEGANVGDIFVVAKLNSLPVYRIIPLNDAKAANSTYAGTNGVMTPWDKSRVNKVDSIEGTANNALNRANNALNNLPTFSESNMNNALATGVYPWCTLGRPANSTGAYTCITIHSTTKDSGGFDTIEQTAYGRQGELGKIYKRIIFKNDSETQFGEWAEITIIGSSSNESDIKKLVLDINDNEVEVHEDYFTFKIHKDIATHMFEIQAIVPCEILESTVNYTFVIGHFNLPLNSLGYRITQYDEMTDDSSLVKISISIDKNITFKGKSCIAQIETYPGIVISYIEP